MIIYAIGYQATQPNTGAAAVPVTGDSLTMLDDSSRHVNIIDWRAKNQVAGFHRIVYQTAHDPIKNMTVPVPVGNIDPLLQFGLAMQPTAQEDLEITIAGSNTAGDVELGWVQIMAPNYRGLQGVYIDWDGVLESTEKEMTIYASLTRTATGWTGTEVVTADSNLMKPNREYACTGFRTDVDVAAVALRGPENSGQRIACPGQATKNETNQQYFAQQSRHFKIPMIPVVNSGARAQTFFEFLCDENATTVVVAAYMTLLAVDWRTRMGKRRK